MQKRNEIEAMNIICNIQAMQDAVYGKHFEHAAFNANTINELRIIQNELLPLYNQMAKKSIKSYDIKITGSGTATGLIHSLKNVIASLESNLPAITATWEDSNLCTVISVIDRL